MLIINFETIKHGWVDITLTNNHFHYKNKLSTIETYFTPELFFSSVIDLLKGKETQIILDKEGSRDYLFLTPNKNDLIHFSLCAPICKSYNYLDYLNENIFSKPIIEFMETYDTYLTILNNGACTLHNYCLNIYNYFKSFTSKNGLTVFKEKALTEFNSELFSKMENLFLTKFG